MSGITFGFIITRHVTSVQTNKLWNHCVQQIRHYYPSHPIVIIDDDSVQEYVVSAQDYSHCTVITSPFPRRGELLPFVCWLQYKWFPAAVILHDSTFIHSYIPFDRLKLPFLPLWHAALDQENVGNTLRIASVLRNRESIFPILQTKNMVVSMSGYKEPQPTLCFGCQCFATLACIESLERIYGITRLIQVVHCRADRCSLERVLGAIFGQFGVRRSRISLFGDIMRTYRSFRYTLEEYEADKARNHIRHSWIKVWTGR